MSSMTAVDLKFGGRLIAACDAVGEGHLNRAAGILAEIVDELNQEATANGLLSEEVEVPTFAPVKPKPAAPQLATASAPADLQMCARGVHSFGDPAPVTGWRTCSVCETVNVAPPENNGFVDMSARR